jgi:hypothetical protein
MANIVGWVVGIEGKVDMMVVYVGMVCAMSITVVEYRAVIFAKRAKEIY